MARDVAECIVMKAMELHKAEQDAARVRRLCKLHETVLRLKVDVSVISLVWFSQKAHVDLRYDGDGIWQITNKDYEPFEVPTSTAMDIIPQLLLEQIQDARVPGRDYRVRTTDIRLVQGTRSWTNRWIFGKPIWKRSLHATQFPGPDPPKDWPLDCEAASALIQSALHFSLLVPFAQ